MDLLTYADNDETCDHSWLTMLLGNAPQADLCWLFLAHL